MDEHVSPYRMDDAVARAACTVRGATTERQRAALMGVSVSTMRRWREGGTPPMLSVVDMVCARLGVSRARLFPGLAAEPEKRTQGDVISEAAAKVVAGWPKLTEAQRLEVARVMSAVTTAPAESPKRRVGRAA
jgi:transcriptional regulator with XRE-family HTH domain